MNSSLAGFAGVLGPGQIIDRHSPAAGQVGFLKIGISNDINDAFLFASSFKEELRSEYGLDIRISLRSFIVSGNDVIEGYLVPHDRRLKNNDDVKIIRFNKSQLLKAEEVRELNGESTNMEEEVLQVSVYAGRKNARSYRKYHIGYVNISLNHVAPHSPRKYDVQSWYKVFRVSSFILGYPTPNRNSYFVNQHNSSSSTLASTIPDDVIQRVRLLRRNKINKLSSFSSNSSSDLRSSTDSSTLTRKKTSFRNVAHVVTRLTNKGKDFQHSVDHSEFSQKSFCELSNNLVKRSRTWSAMSRSPSGRLTHNSSALTRLSSTRFEKFFKLKFLGHPSKNFPSHGKKSVQRCQEYICDAPAVSVWEETGSGGNYSEFPSMNNLSASGPFTRSLLHRPRTFNSVESGSEDVSSYETDDGASRASIKQRHKIFHSFPRKLKQKRKIFSTSQNRFKAVDNDDDDDESCKSYVVLKEIQTMRKLNKDLSCQQSTSFSSRDTESITELRETQPDTSLSQLTAILHPTSPDKSETILQVKTKILKEIASPSTGCHLKREKFARNRSFAFEHTDECERNFQRLSVRKNSDDYYETCSEKMSSTNLSVTSYYSTASERDRLH